MNTNMISTLKRKLNKVALLAVLLVTLLTPLSTVFAQGPSLTLSISPSLFDMSADPGQEWQSTLRVININDFDLTVYVDVVNFLPQGEGGDGRFVPINSSEDGGNTLAEWFTINREAIVVPREQSVEIPFSVVVPFDASPGGHFAAILVGTKPLAPEAGQARVQTSQMVTSLFFARVTGDVIESGNIREFVTTGTYLNSPEADFELRFENKGNVHLKPQGDIRITNMWGEERGVVPINQNSSFGNVLPESVRKFNFTWKGEWSVADIGRYTAVATLAYGADDRQFASAVTTFWVIPFKLLFGILVGLLIFFGLVTFMVKLYVRHMLQMAGINVVEYKKTARGSTAVAARAALRQKVKLHSPLQAGYLDLAGRLRAVDDNKERLFAFITFAKQYKMFFGALLLGFLSLAILTIYIISANTAQRGYEVVYVNSDASVTLTSEEIIYNQMRSEQAIESVPKRSGLPKIKIVNRSGVPGTGATTRLQLEAQGYEVISLEADLESVQAKTVIVYTAANERDALRLSSSLNNALISLSEDSDAQDLVTIFVGGDIAKE